MNDEEGFLQAIAENPSLVLHRLIYADWLEERGDALRAEYLRLEEQLLKSAPRAQQNHQFNQLLGLHPVDVDTSAFLRFPIAPRQGKWAPDRQHGKHWLAHLQSLRQQIDANWLGMVRRQKIAVKLRVLRGQFQDNDYPLC